MRNIGTKVDGAVGTSGELPAIEFNSINDELKSLVTTTGQSFDSGSVVQLATAMAVYAQAGDFYSDSGAANAYVLTATSSKEAPDAYVDGMRVRFKVSASNTGASTVNVNGIGVKDIVAEDRTALTGGELFLDSFVEIRYDSSADEFYIFNQNANAYLKGHINGFEFVNDGDDVFAITSGQCRDKEDSCNIDFIGSEYGAIRKLINTGKVGDVSSTTTDNEGMEISSDGTKLYIGEDGGTIYQFNMSTAYDIETISYSGNSFDTGFSSLRDFSFSINGLKLYSIHDGSDSIYEHTLTTAWDLSTASYSSNSLDISSQFTTIRGVQISSDGTKIFGMGGIGTVYQYSLSTPYDLSSASYDSVSFAPGTITTASRGLQIVNDTFMFINGDDIAYKYVLDTPMSIASVSDRGSISIESNTSIFSSNLKYRYSIDSGDILQYETPAVKYKTTSNWVAGSGNGAKDSTVTLANDTWYYLFDIEKSSTGDIDFYLTNDLTCGNYIADTGYDKYRLITFIYIDSSGNIANIYQQNDRFYYKNELYNSSGSLPTSETFLSAIVPVGFNFSIEISRKLEHTTARTAYIVNPFTEENIQQVLNSGRDIQYLSTISNSDGEIIHYYSGSTGSSVINQQVFEIDRRTI